MEWVAKVGRPRAGDPEHWSVRREHVVRQLLVLALVVLFHDAEIALRAYKLKLQESYWRGASDAHLSA